MRTSPRLSSAVVFALLLYVACAVLLLQIQLLPEPKTDRTAAVSDLFSYYYPTLRYGFDELRHGRFPLWSPRQACGIPFIAALHHGLLYPLYAPFLVLDAARAIDVHIVLHLTLASLGVFLLCRHWGIGIPAALLAGLIYTYQGGMMVYVYFPDFLTSCAWIPWLILTVDRTLARPSGRRAAAIAVVLALSFLGGHGIQFVYFTAWALVPLVLLRVFTRYRQQGIRSVAIACGWVVLGALAGALLGMVRLVPTAEFVRDSWRAPGRLGEFSTIVPVPPQILAPSLLTPAPPRKVVGPLYVGTVSLILAAIGLVRWRRDLTIPIALAASAAVLYSFGTHGFLFPIVSQLPMGKWFQGPGRSFIIFALAVTVLGAAGLDTLLGTARGASPRPASRLRAIALVIASSAALLLGGYLFGARQGRAYMFAYAGMAALLLSLIVLVRGRIVRSVAVVMLGLLVGYDLVHAQWFVGRLPSQAQSYFTAYDPLFARIRERQGLDRTYVFSPVLPDVPFRFHSDLAKAGLNHGVWMATDYEPLCGQRFGEYVKALGPLIFYQIGYVPFRLNPDNLQLAELMGIRFYMMEKASEERFFADLPLHKQRWTPIAEEEGIVLYEYSQPMPRVFLVDQVEVVPDSEALLNRLRSADLHATAFIEEPLERPLASDATADRATTRAAIVDYAPDRVAVEVEAPHGGFLVLTDQYDRSWSAWVDGVAARIYRTNYLFRGIRLDPGTHRVEFAYRPMSFAVGAVGSLLGVILTGVMIWRGRGTDYVTTCAT